MSESTENHAPDPLRALVESGMTYAEAVAAEDGRRCPATTESGTPCQKVRKRLSDGEWLHGGGHWFASDDLHACMTAGHFDPANVLSMTPLAHLDVPCPRRVIPPVRTDR